MCLASTFRSVVRLFGVLSGVPSLVLAVNTARSAPPDDMGRLPRPASVFRFIADTQTAPSSKMTGGEDDNEDAGKLRWFVYRDSSSPENHGVWTNIMPPEGAQMLKVRLTDRAEPAFGAQCIRVHVTFQSPNWCGLAVSSQPDYWGKTPSDKAFDLRQAKKLVFYARGEKGGESIQVKLAIAGDQPYGDSTRTPAETEFLTLNKTWQRYELPIPPGMDLHRVITPFCFVTSSDRNSADEFTFYLDHIYFLLGDK